MINLGSRFEISIGDTARAIAEIMNTDVEFETDGDRIRPNDSEVERLLRRMQRQAAYRMAAAYGGRDGFSKGLENTIGWFTEERYTHLYKPDSTT